jgi:HAD superfamily hydrolase (TIGR01458 family)
MDGVDGVLLDIDGVLALSWRALPGAVETVNWLRSRRLPFRLLTNTTTHACKDLAGKLGDAGIAVEPREIITAVVGTATYLRTHRAGARVFLLTDGDARDDMDGIQLVEDDADIVVIGGACDDFSYANLNRVFRMLAGGAELVGMHRNLYWRTVDGLELDGGAYIAGLEEAASVTATICGKPSPTFFQAALDVLDVPANRAAMVGDDVVNDVLGAQALGITGVLVKTGKYSADDARRGDPNHVIDSVGQLPRLLGAP